MILSQQLVLTREWWPFMTSIERLVDEPLRTQIKAMIEDNADVMSCVWGSVHNHQAWTGGWIDHYADGFNEARMHFALENWLRPLPFTLHDVIVAFFAHDIEKPWKYELRADGLLYHRPEFNTKQDANEFRLRKLAEYGIELTPLQANAMEFAEGEGAAGKYSNRQRMSSELAGFIAGIDLLSARVRHDYPLAHDDPWTGAHRSHTSYA